MKFTFVLLFALFGLTLAQAQVQGKMQEFYMILNKVRPYLTDKTGYMDTKNEKEIAQALKEFNESVKALKKEKMTGHDDMKFRAAQLSEGLEDAEKTFRDGFKDYSFWVLKASMNNCFACHTQKGLVGTDYKFDKDAKLDPFANAEFLFIVRNYKTAIPLFEELLGQYPENKLAVESLETSLQKLLYYYVRVLRDDNETLASFNKLLKNQKLPSTVRNDILAWKKYLTVKKYRISDAPQVTDVKSLQDFLAEREAIASHYNLANQRHIVDLETGHFLYQLLEKTPDLKLKPWILLGLAELEKDYRLTMFDLSAEQYLKECIQQYPKDKAAKKCLALFREIKTASFTGSRGTDIPASVKREFEKFESLVNQ